MNPSNCRDCQTTCQFFVFIKVSLTVYLILLNIFVRVQVIYQINAEIQFFSFANSSCEHVGSLSLRFHLFKTFCDSPKNSFPKKSCERVTVMAR